MKIKAVSGFKTQNNYNYLENWNTQVQQLYGTIYDKINVKTSLGNTVVWSLNSDKNNWKTLVIFPGARTCAMFWELNNVLADLKKKYRLYLVDVNGQPSLSEGNSPDISSNDYGVWAAEVIKGLGLQKTIVAGASLGGLICLKLCITTPELVEKAILLNPAGIGAFSLSLKNLYYNLLPIINPSRKSISKFLENAVFHKQHHNIPETDKDLLIDYQFHALNNFKDKSDKPAKGIPAGELNKIKPDIYLILGDKDILFPYKKTIAIARKEIPSLKEAFVLPNTAHGIELSKQALQVVDNIISKNQ